MNAKKTSRYTPEQRALIAEVGRAAALMASRGEGARLAEKVRQLLVLADGGEPLQAVWVGLDGEDASTAPGLAAMAATDGRVHVPSSL